MAIKNKLYDSNSTMYILGGLLRKPELLHGGDFLLTEVDFHGLHKIIFSSIFNLSANGVMKLTPMDIDLYLKQYTTQYEFYEKENGLEYCQNIYSLIDANFEEEQFRYYYERVKKFTILRDFDSSGIDIKQLYDPDVDFTKIDKENEKLNNTTIDDLFKAIHTRVSNVEERNTVRNNLKSMDAGHGLRKLVEDFKLFPQVGLEMEGEILTAASRGARDGALFLYSSPTGHGKTRFLVGNACAMSLPYIKDNKIITRDNLTSVLFIATEMDPEEIQTLVLAYVSGVDEERILTGTYNAEEKRLIEIALNIIEEYSEKFRIEKLSDPDINTLRIKIVNYILKDQFSHVFYDYIFTSGALNSQFSKTGLREDVVLMMLANGLKQIASDHNVFIFSGTQVNRGWEKAQFRNENSLAGSKAIADKADFGMVAIKMTQEEKEKIQPLLFADGITDIPNVVIDIYKNRRGRITNAKIFRVFDYATCRAKDLMLTDTNYNKWSLGMNKSNYTYQMKDLLDVAVSNSD